MGKFLRVNLSKEKWVEENMPGSEFLRKWIGGAGLGTLLLHYELPRGASPTSPGSPLIINTGPLTGMGYAPGCTDFAITTFNPETGYTVVHSHSHGYWGSNLKFAGYDGLMVEGVASDPVYLWIHDGEVEIRDAGAFWGKTDSKDTSGAIQEDLNSKDARVLAIGPAGENMVSGAIFVNEGTWVAARGAAVAGSKKLKAIAVYGTRRVPVHDKARLIKIGDEWRDKIEMSIVGPKPMFGKYVVQAYGMSVITNNWQTTVFDPAKYAEHWEDEEEYINMPCFQCKRGCAAGIRYTAGPYEGLTGSIAAGGEMIEGVSSVVGIGGRDVHRLVWLEDRLGMEGGFMGSVLGLAFECFEKGLITENETDGLRLEWGNVKAAEELIRRIAYREGWLGNLLADGPKEAAERIGGKAREIVVHIKGAGPSFHDWRYMYQIMLTQFVGQGGGWSMAAPGFGQAYPLEECVSSVWDSKRFTGIVDMCGMCWFASGYEEYTVDLLSATTGWDITHEEAMLIGERKATMEHIFDLLHGRTPETELEDVGPRFLEPVPDGPRKGAAIKPHLEQLLRDYYRVAGWSFATGRPLPGTLRRLGLEEIARELGWEV